MPVFAVKTINVELPKILVRWASIIGIRVVDHGEVEDKFQIIRLIA
ncbi:hypothetical protein LYNGBM3L_00990 [Moorena producens 3L]|uniref:Uncharacterized protein n=1 Tax=Moorena producens 3L TaxID=489825 RepID=F4XIG7_9CYAN|nr:hypothetical protein LYNGBM3L_00990 [Moorena producens 3L]